MCDWFETSFPLEIWDLCQGSLLASTLPPFRQTLRPWLNYADIRAITLGARRFDPRQSKRGLEDFYPDAYVSAPFAPKEKPAIRKTVHRINEFARDHLGLTQDLLVHTGIRGKWWMTTVDVFSGCPW
jgi:hypothetical protein